MRSPATQAVTTNAAAGAPASDTRSPATHAVTTTAATPIAKVSAP